MAVKLNTAGEAHLKALIDAGKYNVATAWDFGADDGDALLGANGDNWDRYGSVHLGVDDAEADRTKAHWKYPAAKANGEDGEEVFRAGLVAAKDRAAQEGVADIADAADRLIQAIDDAEGDDAEDNKPAAAAAPAAPAVRANPARGRVVGRDLPHMLGRIFDTPLLIDAAKMDVILAVLGPRLNLVLQGAIALPRVDGGAATDLDEIVPPTGPLLLSGDSEDNDDECPYQVTDDGIAVISAAGTLVYKSSWLNALSGLTSYCSVTDAVAAAVADPSVKGILLQVDSFGGEANGCFDAADAIFAMRAQKPIYGVAADNARSGGYALLASASKIYVSRTSGVGSIGVVCGHVDQSAADKMDGLKYTFVYSGDRKLDGNPHVPLSAEARSVMQNESDRLRMLFASSVAKYRGLSVDAVIATQAATYWGENAIGAKLADAVGTPDDALNALRAELTARSKPAMPLLAAPPTPAAVEAAPAPEATPAGVVVDLNTVRDRAAGDAAALHAEIVNLCTLAGAPQLASEFITGRVSIEQVRTRLQDARAHASDARQTRGHILPDAGDHALQQVQTGWESAIRAVRGGLKGDK